MKSSLIGFFLALVVSLSGLAACAEKNTSEPLSVKGPVPRHEPDAVEDDVEIPEVRFSVQGHRGARAIFPENTEPSFDHALEAKADQIEFDIQFLSDDTPVVWHDAFISSKHCKYLNGTKISGEIFIRTLTLEQIKQFDCGSKRVKKMPEYLAPGERIMSLKEFLTFVKQSTHPRARDVVYKWDIKSNEKTPEYFPTPDRIAEVVLRYTNDFNILKRSVYSSFDKRVLLALRDLESSAKIAWLLDCALTEKILTEAKNYRMDTLSPHHLAVRLQGAKKWTKRIQEVGIHFVPYTVNDPKHWKKFIEAGMYGIITDDPKSLRAFYMEHVKNGGSTLPTAQEIAEEADSIFTDEQVTKIVREAINYEFSVN